MDKPDIGVEELMELIPGPDFPTGGAILGRAGIRSAYATGRGSIIMRAKVAVEELRKDREALIVTEIPYQVNKATLIERIAELVREKKHRRHRRSARRVRPRRHAHRHRAQARRGRRRGAQPVVALHRDAVELRRQHDRAERRSAGDADAEGHAGRLPRLPRGSGDAAHQASADQGARRRAYPGRPGDRGRQHRRGHPPHPHLARPGGGPRRADGARLAGARHGAADRADRRSAPRAGRGRDDAPLRRRRRAPFSTCGSPA